MKIGVVAPAPVPYTRGGFERLLSGLVNHLNEATDHQAELVKLPFPETTLHEVIAGYRNFAGLDVSGFDLVITAKYPAWMVDHPNQIVYLCHTLRGLYDTYPDSFPTSVDSTWGIDDLAERLDRAVASRSRLGELWAIYDEAVARLGADHPAFGHPGPLGRKLVHKLDRIGMGAARRHLAIAQTVADRPGYFPPGAHVEVVFPPTDLPAQPRTVDGTYFFTASRLDAPKRLDMVIEAYRASAVDVPLRIAGSGPERDRLQAAAADDPRIEFLGFVPDEDLPDLYAGAIAVPFVPDREDYGLIALEALASGTPVITCTDSGGPTELVSDGTTGVVVEPQVDQLAEAFERLAANPDQARTMGLNGCQEMSGITWSRLSARLLGPRRSVSKVASGRDVPARTGKPLLVALSTFVSHNPRGGGQLRALHLYRALTSRFDVHLLSLAPTGAQEGTVVTSPGFAETSVARTWAHSDAENEAAAQIGVPANDLVGGSAIALTPRYLAELSTLLGQASAVILSHPYMAPSLDLVGCSVPVVYDAHNVEVRLKDTVYPRSAAADAAVAQVRQVELDAISRSVLVALCSTEDEAVMRSVYGALPPTVVIANGTKVDEIPFATGVERIANRTAWLRSAGFAADKRIALYLASWHPPNLEAAEQIHAMAPELPDVLFLMIGSHVDYFAGRRLPENVLQIGLVGDATKRVLLSSADLGVNPMATGSGTNLKLVEYLASGLQTVTTATGARGLPDSELFTTSDLPGFAAAIEAAIATDHDAAASIDRAVRARAMIEEQFAWRVLGERLADAVQRAVVDG
ncbi:MAG: glycosyltransferase [Acidimicrobiales bacterium]|nr:glycosyltransferase family 4 protein [Acidimicrobiales bacterium]